MESGAEVKKRQAEAEAETNSEVVGMDKSFLESKSDVIMAEQIKRINDSLRPPSRWLRFQLESV